MDQKEAFEKAVADSKQLPDRPDNNTLLRLYSLYKQSTEGDVNTAIKPVLFDFVAQAKFDAWLKLKGAATDEAMRQYIELVSELKEK
jgi:diazepam-binding inhibitor (GABA receptor modulating acyl-CoA-binding protein)